MEELEGNLMPGTSGSPNSKSCWAGTGEILETMLRFGALCNGKMEPNDTKHIHTMDVHRTDTQVPTRVPQKPPCITTYCPGRAHRRSG